MTTAIRIARVAAILTLAIWFFSTPSLAIAEWMSDFACVKGCNVVRLNSTDLLAYNIVNPESLVLEGIDEVGTGTLRATVRVKDALAVHSAVCLGGERMLFLASKGYTNEESVLATFVLRLDSLNVTWKNSYPIKADPQCSLISPSLLRTGADRFVFAVGCREYAKITEIGPEGEVRWNWTLDANILDSNYMLARSSSKPSGDIVFAGNIKMISTIITFGPNRTVVSTLIIDKRYQIVSLTECGNGELLVVTKEGNLYNGPRWIMKFDRTRKFLWVQSAQQGKMTVNAVIVSELSGEYVAIGNRGNDFIASPNNIMFVGLSQTNGTTRWRKTMRGSGLIVSMIEMGRREYVFALVGSPGMITKFSVPEHVEELRCADLANCRGCSMGHFWNYTACAPCPRGCASCLNERFCTGCISGFRKVHESRSCIPAERNHVGSIVCNCSAPEGPDCRLNCTSVARCDLNSTDIVSYSHSGRRRRCICPQESLDNGTHCIRIHIGTACSGLCERCVLEPDQGGKEFEFCLTCKSLPRVMLHQTGRLFVDCRCAFGYDFNGSACSRETSSSIHDPDPGSDTPAASDGFALLIIGGTVVLVMATVAGLVWRSARGSRPLQSQEVTEGKIQKTPRDEAQQQNSVVAVIAEK